jgi:hypothetical protein
MQRLPTRSAGFGISFQFARDGQASLGTTTNVEKAVPECL